MDKQEKPKGPGGRPTKYDPKYCEEIIKFFNREPSVPLIVDGEVMMHKGEPIMIACRLPTFEMFALSIGVHRETLRNWADANPEFFAAYKKAEDYQKEILIQNGLSGGYEKTFAIFTAKNVTDMTDKTQVEQKSVVVNVSADMSATDAERAYKELMGGGS